MMTDDEFDRGSIYLKQFAAHPNCDEIKMAAAATVAITRCLLDLTKQVKRLADHLAGPEPEPVTEEPQIEDQGPRLKVVKS